MKAPSQWDFVPVFKDVERVCTIHNLIITYEGTQLALQMCRAIAFFGRIVPGFLILFNVF